MNKKKTKKRRNKNTRAKNVKRFGEDARAYETCCRVWCVHVLVYTGCSQTQRSARGQPSLLPLVPNYARAPSSVQVAATLTGTRTRHRRRRVPRDSLCVVIEWPPRPVFTSSGKGKRRAVTFSRGFIALVTLAHKNTAGL